MQKTHPLEVLKFCPKCGSPQFEIAGERSLKCGSCGFHYYINASAAVAGLVTDGNGRLMLVTRGIEPDYGKLDLPGGFVDQGESAEAAALREVREETGIELQQIKYLFSLPNSYHYRDLVYDTLDLIYCCHFTELPQMQAADDLDQLLWIDRESVQYERIAFTSLRKAVQLYLERTDGTGRTD